MKKLYIILFLASVVSFQVFGQSKKADKLFDYYSYAEAIPYYLKAIEKEEGKIRERSIVRLADCYRMVNNAPKAKEWYEKALEQDKVEPMVYFYYGQSLRSIGEYKKAAEAFAKYNELVPDDEAGQRYFDYSKAAQQWKDMPPSAEVKSISELNTRFSDFGPVFYRDGIVFTSDRHEKADMQENKYGWTNFNYLNLYYTIPAYHKVYWNGVPEPQKMSRNFNQNYHDGPACFSADNRWIYVSRTVHSKGKKVDGNIKTHMLKIYYAEITGEKKPEFKEFAYNSKSYSVGHPALSADGETLVFSSDMPGGYGGSDLYICKKENGRWSNPVNLGENVNSVGDEVFPCQAANGKLYFSSNGHLGYGGLDIFSSTPNGEEWGEVENLHAPLNSSFDDFGIVFKDEKEGLFSSNRPEGKGSDDIYGFKLIEKPVVVEVPQLTIKGRVVDSNLEPIEGATVFLLNPVSNTVKILMSNANGYYADQSKFNQTYVVKAMKDGYIYDCTSFRTPAEDVKEYAVPRDLVLVKLEVDQVFEVENIYYDLDKWFIRTDAEPSLDNLVRILKQYPITAELSSHTDCRASHEYNNDLSQKRAESAVRYIILQGVDPSRITAKGYGETQLVNHCADGVDCTEEEHQQNRRTEFKITSVGSSVAGNYFDLSIYKNGDIVPAASLGVQFFDNCAK